MKKFLFIVTLGCAACFISGCGKTDYTKKVLECVKTEEKNGASNQLNYTIRFLENGDVNQICFDQISTYQDETRAQAGYDFCTVQANVYLNNGEEASCSIDEKKVESKRCYPRTSIIGEDRGTYNQEKKYFKNEGYTCTEKNAD